MANGNAPSIIVADKDVVEMIDHIERDLTTAVDDTKKPNLARLLSDRSVYDAFHQYYEASKGKTDEVARLLKDAFTKRASVAVSLAEHPEARADNIHRFWLKARDWLFPEEPPEVPKVFISHKHAHESFSAPSVSCNQWLQNERASVKPRVKGDCPFNGIGVYRGQ